jgi:PBP1b-binding outer membrane lipoprotein LpoB
MELRMRALILLATAALALSACGNNDQSDNTQNVDENLTAENIVSNDVTAIDAVTGDAANMAADVDYSNLTDNSLDNMVNQDSGSKPPAKAHRAKSQPAEPVANTATNAE